MCRVSNSSEYCNLVKKEIVTYISLKAGGWRLPRFASYLHSIRWCRLLLRCRKRLVGERPVRQPWIAWVLRCWNNHPRDDPFPGFVSFTMSRRRWNLKAFCRRRPRAIKAWSWPLRLHTPGQYPTWQRSEFPKTGSWDLQHPEHSIWLSEHHALSFWCLWERGWFGRKKDNYPVIEARSWNQARDSTHHNIICEQGIWYKDQAVHSGCRRTGKSLPT